MNKAVRLVVYLVVIVAVLYGGYRITQSKVVSLVPSADKTASKDYSAVFLVNDQVYFGKLTTSGSAVVLTDVYYIRLNNPSTNGGDVQQPQSSTAQQQLQLVKLGDQIHAPVDQMRINADQVLFVERLQDTSAVVTGIEKDKAQRASGTTPTTDQSTSTTPTTTTPATTDTTKK